MVNYISGLVFVLLLAAGSAASLWRGGPRQLPGRRRAAGYPLADRRRDLSSAIQLAAQWEKAVVFRLGRYHGSRGPACSRIIPLVDQVRMVDTRVLAVDIPKQQVITATTSR